MNYRECSVEELADYVEQSPCTRITQQLKYYQNKGDSLMVEKIKEARKIVKKRKLIRQLEGM